MDVSTLLADPKTIGLEGFISNADSITIVVRTSQKTGRCPLCHESSNNLHGNYVRRIADLPWHNVSVRLQLHTRKFRCRNELCPRQVFCERLPKVVASYARKTVRLNSAMTLLAFVLGGEAGARTAAGLGLTVSGDTLLRRIRSGAVNGADISEVPRVLGVDDFAFRRGHRYGTILVDLEKRKAIDLLPDREAETLKNWLAAHPGVEIISRDRAGAYADGARRGAPDAKQVADRWHLLKNAGEVFEKTLSRNYSSLKKSLIESTPENPAEKVEAILPTIEAQDNESDESSENPLLSAYHQERKAIYDLVKRMQEEGLTINQTRLQINRHHTLVARFYRAEEYPLTTRPKGSRLMRPYTAYLRSRWAEGCHNAKQLYRELLEKGYRGSALTVRRATTQWRLPVPLLVEQPPPKLPSARQLIWLLLKPEEKLKIEERQWRQKIFENSTEVKLGLELLEKFREMIRQRKIESYEDWLQAAAGSGLTEFQNFVTSLKRDQSAVKNALIEEWSNGQVEGQINRLKFIKRQMYGRAKFDLLRARVIYQN